MLKELWKVYFHNLGKENLIKRKETPQKKLVGLELIGKEKANHGDCISIKLKKK